MKSIILKTASNYLLPLLLLFSVFVLLRGHYLPGGGFIGGLVASIAFVLHAFANGLSNTKNLLRVHPGFFIPAGLTLSLGSGFAPMVLKQLPFMTGVWFKIHLRNRNDRKSFVFRYRRVFCRYRSKFNYHIYHI